MAEVNVLVVEDEAPVMNLLVEMIKAKCGEKIHIWQANNVRGAYFYLGEVEIKIPFDLIISDIGLPDGSGKDVISLAQKIATEQKRVCWTVAMSAESPPEGLTADVFLRKPNAVLVFQYLIEILVAKIIWPC